MATEYKKLIDDISGAIIDFYKEHGDNHGGVGWLKQNGLNERYSAHCSVIKEPGTVLDFGCGLAALNGWMKENGYEKCDYTGLETSEPHYDACVKKFPNLKFIKSDFLSDPESVSNYDYVILCGILTMKVGYTNEMMWEYTKDLLRKIWQKANKGISFNLMTKFVDWEREDLYHVSFDQIAKFVNDELSRDFEIKAHYGDLYEYTVIVNKKH
jgi:SAM-dependent methyltransferase